MSPNRALPIPTLLLLLAFAAPVRAQDELPSNLLALETARSRTCVDVLTRLERLDKQLEPYAGRAQRLLAIAGAIQIEDPTIVDSLHVSDPLEGQVAEWFQTDQSLAQRFVDSQDPTIAEQRSTGRHTIQDRLASAIDSVQAEADSIMATTGDLQSQASGCSGAVLLRGTAVEACQGITSRVCTAARDSTVDQDLFPFIDTPDLLWNRQEFRPWSQPGPLQITQDGQLRGARTVGSTRVGNVVVSLAFSPLLRARAELQPEQLATLDSIDSALNIEDSHPDIAFAPALSIQANLPEALGNETYYILHFGEPDSPDVLWSADANTGQPLAGNMALAPRHVARLRAGDPMTLTAIHETETGDPEGVFAIELSSVNQVAPVEALLGYMTKQMSADLKQLIPPQPDSTAGAN